jgi:hypothetical protein
MIAEKSTGVKNALKNLTPDNPKERCLIHPSGE